MARKKRGPPLLSGGEIEVRSYFQLRRFTSECSKRRIRFLVIRGRPGIGKSQAAKKALGKKPFHHFGANTSALDAYLALCDRPDIPVLIDDNSKALRDSQWRDLLLELCDSKKSRTVRWQTKSPHLKDKPRSITVTGPVMLLTNVDLSEVPPVLIGVMDRGIRLHFNPTRRNIVRYIRTFAKDQALVDLMERLPIDVTPRLYAKALSLRKGKIDVEEYLLKQAGYKTSTRVLIGITQEHPTASRKRWIELYMEEANKSERTFYNDLKIVKEMHPEWPPKAFPKEPPKRPKRSSSKRKRKE